MTTYILKRIAAMVPTWIGITLLVFLMVHLVPGDPAQIMLGERASAETIAALRTDLGLDQPLHIQIWRFFEDLFNGDLGRSLRTHEKISTELAQRFPATCELTLFAMILAIFGGISAGTLAAARRGRFIDLLTMVGATAGISMPIFWLALMLILGFGVLLPIFPLSGRLATQNYMPAITHFYIIDALLNGDFYALKDVLWHLVLPAVSLCTIPLAVIARITRACLLEVLGADYIRTAWAKGLSERLVLLRHALKNAFIPTLTIIALEFGYLLGGAIITETIFAWPGLGRWLFLAVQARDFRAIQGGVLLIATVFMVVNLIADILYIWLDPRIRYNAST